MLHQIQNHLFQYKGIVIPQVGTFKIEQLPATLDVANQMMVPPSYAVRFSGKDAVAQAQLQALAPAHDYDTETTGAELNRFGEAFKAHLQQQPFLWNGIGMLELSETQEVHFKAGSTDAFLMPVHAQKVLRENVQHSVLVGDQQIQYGAEFLETEARPETTTRPWLLITAWILLLCTVLFLFYYLYTHNWLPEAAGLRQKPVIEGTPVQHR